MSVRNIIIIGSGPGGYSAAVHAADVKPLLFEGEYSEKTMPGGQLMTTTDVDNYPGFPNGTTGPELMEKMKEHALSRGVEIYSLNVVRVEKTDGVFIVEDSEGNLHQGRAVILATGAFAKRLYVPGTREGEFWQKGISACAVCDGFAFRGKRVSVIGGGDSAMEEALYLANIASTVYLIHRRNEFRAREDKINKIKETENIKLVTPAELVSAHGDSVLRSLKLKNNETGELFSLEVDGLFFAIGHTPNVQFLNGIVALDENGYVVVDENLQTTLPGLFACGDVQDHTYRQAVTAAASGCVAAMKCLKLLDG